MTNSFSLHSICGVRFGVAENLYSNTRECTENSQREWDMIKKNTDSIKPHISFYSCFNLFSQLTGHLCKPLKLRIIFRASILLATTSQKLGHCSFLSILGLRSYADIPFWFSKGFAKISCIITGSRGLQTQVAEPNCHNFTNVLILGLHH